MTSETRLIKVGGRSDHRNSPKFFDLKVHEISQIFVSAKAEVGISSIQFQYIENGKYVLSETYGSCYGSSQFHTIELNYPAEYITSVYGQYSTTADRIQVITFTSNIQKYGPFGVTNPNMLSKFDDGKSFAYNLGKSCQFGGFHGSYYWYGVASLGFYLSAKKRPPSFDSRIPKREA